MGKNKAASADELLDTIFQVKEWKKLEIKLIKENMMRKDWKKDNFQNSEEYKGNKEEVIIHSGQGTNHIKYILAKNLTEYLNYVLKNKMELPY